MINAYRTQETIIVVHNDDYNNIIVKTPYILMTAQGLYKKDWVKIKANKHPNFSPISINELPSDITQIIQEKGWS